MLLGPEDRPGDKWLASLQAAVGRARSALLAGSSQATTAAPAPAHGEAAVVDAAAAPTATPSAGPAEEQAVATEPTAPAAATEAAKQAPEAQQPKQQKQQSKQLREAMVPGAVSLIVGCHGLGAQLPQGWALDTLHTALAAAAATSATGAPSSTSPSPTPKEQGCSEPSSDTESQDSPARAAPYLPELATPLLQRCSGAQLAQLADALVAMGEAPSGQLQQAYAQAVWPKLYQLSPAQVRQQGCVAELLGLY